MSEETPPASRQDLPLFGYVYELDGMYHAPIELGSFTQLENFMVRVAKPCMENGQEIRITDVDDHMVFWAKEGAVKWPNETMVPPSE